MVVRPLARIGVIGDVHAEDQLLVRALDHFANLDRPPQAVLCTGDIVDGEGSVEGACEALIQHQVATVRGNHDRWLLGDTCRHVPNAHRLTALSDDAHTFLAALPATREFDTVRGRLLLCHGVGTNDLAKVWPGSSRMAPERSARLDRLIKAGGHRLIVNGHMHYRTVIQFEGATLVNAGTLRRDHRPGSLLIDLIEGTIESFAIDRDRVHPLVKLPLTCTAQRIWPDTAAFDGEWTPPVLY
jgi:predicted phosphodiesterase